MINRNNTLKLKSTQDIFLVLCTLIFLISNKKRKLYSSLFLKLFYKYYEEFQKKDNDLCNAFCIIKCKYIKPLAPSSLVYCSQIVALHSPSLMEL